MSDSEPPEAEAQPTNVFGDLSPEEERELRKLQRRRAAVWGAGTGAVMAIVLAACIILLYLASQRSG
jgi:hypothetical protein